MGLGAYVALHLRGETDGQGTLLYSRVSASGLGAARLMATDDGRPQGPVMTTNSGRAVGDNQDSIDGATWGDFFLGMRCPRRTTDSNCGARHGV